MKLKGFVSLRLKGVTLVELLVVLAIVGILATVAIPNYTRRVDRAKVASSKQETREIAQAMETCALIHGFYVPIQVLDDIPDAPGVMQSPTADSIVNENSTIAVIDPNVSPADQRTDGQLDFGDFGLNTRITSLLDDWQGPFLNPQRVLHGQIPSNTSDVFFDHPLDPWGQPYRFYSPIGIIGSDALSLVNFDTQSFSDGRLTQNDDRFDRYAIVSFGRDTVDDSPGETEAERDDIVYYHGTVPNESGFKNTL